MQYFPVEFMVLGAAVRLRKRTVTSREVSDFQKTFQYPLEFGAELRFSVYDEGKDEYTINNNIPPYILNILTYFQ